MVFLRFILFCVDAVNEFLGKNCPYVAGAIAFYTLFSIFPLMLAVISVLGYVVGPQANQNELAVDVARIIPVSSQFIGETVKGVVSARAITGVASVFGLLWGATSAFSAIRKGINTAWGIRKTRPFLKERLMDLGLVIGAAILFLIVLFMAPTLGVMKGVMDILFPEAEYFSKFIWNMVSRLISPGLTLVAFLTLYRFMPNTEVRFKDIWPGAALACVAFHGVSQGFVWYVQTFPVYNLVYGSVGAILALLTWVYLSAIIVLFGALITSRYAKYSASLEGHTENPKEFWTGFSRVRVRVVEVSDVA